jgi:hypothetical protein
VNAEAFFFDGSISHVVSSKVKAVVRSALPPMRSSPTGSVALASRAGGVNSSRASSSAVAGYWLPRQVIAVALISASAGPFWTCLRASSDRII